MALKGLKSIYNKMGLKKFVDVFKGTTKKLLLKILQKVSENKKFERRFVDILFVLGTVDSIVKKVNIILTEMKLE